MERIVRLAFRAGWVGMAANLKSSVWGLGLEDSRLAGSVVGRMAAVDLGERVDEDAVSESSSFLGRRVKFEENMVMICGV